MVIKFQDFQSQRKTSVFFDSGETQLPVLGVKFISVFF